MPISSRLFSGVSKREKKQVLAEQVYVNIQVKQSRAYLQHVVASGD